MREVEGELEREFGRLGQTLISKYKREKDTKEMNEERAVVVAKWSTCSPSIPTIRV